MFVLLFCLYVLVCSEGLEPLPVSLRRDTQNKLKRTNKRVEQTLHLSLISLSSVSANRHPYVCHGNAPRRGPSFRTGRWQPHPCSTDTRPHPDRSRHT